MKLRELIWVISHGNTTDLGGDVGLHFCALFLLAFEYWGRVSGKVFQAMQRYLAASLGGSIGSIGPIIGVEGLPVLWRSSRHGEEWGRKIKRVRGKFKYLYPGGARVCPRDEPTLHPPCTKQLVRTPDLNQHSGSEIQVVTFSPGTG